MTNNNTNDYKGLMKEYLGKNGKSVKIGMLTAMAATVLSVGVPSVASADEYVEDTRDGFFGSISTDVLNADPNAEQVDVNTDTVVEYIDEATFNTLEDWQKEHVTWINDHRSTNNVKPVELDLSLSQQAYMKSVDMAENNYFAHDKKGVGGLKEQNEHFFNGETEESSKNGDNFGENIYWTSHGTDKESNSESSFEGFMNSPGHNSNMAFANYDRVGVGQYKDETGKTHVTQIFYVDDWSTGEVIPVDSDGKEIEEEIEIIEPPVEKEVEPEDTTQIPDLDDNEDRTGEISEEELDSEVEVPEITEEEEEEDETEEVEEDTTPEPEVEEDTESTESEDEVETEDETEDTEEDSTEDATPPTPEDVEEDEVVEEETTETEEVVEEEDSNESTNADTPEGGTETEVEDVESTETTESTESTESTDAQTPEGEVTDSEEVVEVVDEDTVLDTEEEVTETVEDGGEVVSGAVPTEDGETLETGTVEVETNTIQGNGNVDDTNVTEDTNVEDGTVVVESEVTEDTNVEEEVSEEPATPTSDVEVESDDVVNSEVESDDVVNSEVESDDVVNSEVNTEEVDSVETTETDEEDKLPDTGIASTPTTAIAGVLMAMGAGLIAFRRKIFGTKEQ